MRTEKLHEAVICGARLFSVSRQVGAHLWHEGRAGALQWDSNPQPPTLVSLKVQAPPLSHILLLRLLKYLNNRGLFLYRYETITGQ